MRLAFTTFIILVCLSGCKESQPSATHQDAIAALEAQIDTVNRAILANHPIYTEGREKERSLNVDALDFMVGQPIDQFPDLFRAAGAPVTITETKQNYPDDRMADWMAENDIAVGKPQTYHLLYTRIGLTFGYEAQFDYLVIASDNGKVSGWELFSITEY